METTASPIAGFLLLLRLGFFFGLAFEEFHAQGGQARPGSIRSSPSLAHAGGLLYRLVTIASSPTICCRRARGLLVLSGWLACYDWRHVEEIDPEGQPNGGRMVRMCNVLAYLLGPIALAEPPRPRREAQPLCARVSRGRSMGGGNLWRADDKRV